MQAAVALEQLGEPAALKLVKRQLRKEKVANVRAEWLRALGACGRGDARVARQLLAVAEDDDDDARVRRNAVLALGHVLPEPSAKQFLEHTATYALDELREVAVLALALGRSVESRAVIDATQDGEPQAQLLAVREAALHVLDGGNLVELEPHVGRVSGSDVPRPRLFFRN